MAVVACRSGGGTLVFLGSCWEKEGKLASAWGAFREALDLASRDKRPDREKYARDHIASMEPSLRISS